MVGATIVGSFSSTAASTNQLVFQQRAESTAQFAFSSHQQRPDFEGTAQFAISNMAAATQIQTASMLLFPMHTTIVDARIVASAPTTTSTAIFNWRSVVRPSVGRRYRITWHRRNALRARDLAAQQARDYKERLKRIFAKQITRKAQRQAWIAAERQRLAQEAQRRRDLEATRQEEEARRATIERQQQYQRELREAKARALALLLSFLTSEEQHELETQRTITITGRSGKRYRLGSGRGIEELANDNLPTHRWCVHPSDTSLPYEDVMLAQILHLRANDNELARIANRMALR